MHKTFFIFVFGVRTKRRKSDFYLKVENELKSKIRTSKNEKFENDLESKNDFYLKSSKRRFSTLNHFRSSHCKR